MMYPIDLHTHTLVSTHAYSTLSDYVAAAKQKGIKLFANTDHGPDLPDAPHPWHFANLPVIPRFIDGVAIIRGIEANIKNVRGEIDCTPQMLAGLDFVIAGLHDPVCPPQDKETNTATMIAAIANEAVHMISHPGNPKFPIDIYAVAEAAKKHEVALEINNSSFIHSRVGSEDNCRKIAQAVKDVGGYLALGTDSHIASALGDFEHCQRILNDVDFPSDRILNVSARRFLDFLQHRTGKVIEEFAHL
jgi:putative hydrolase